tara:strand:+ start:880 stop:1221 length:342 start_codon:yes stop_codon:yes gene_type:complete
VKEAKDLKVWKCFACWPIFVLFSGLTHFGQWLIHENVWWAIIGLPLMLLGGLLGVIPTFLIPLLGLCLPVEKFVASQKSVKWLKWSIATLYVGAIVYWRDSIFNFWPNILQSS